MASAEPIPTGYSLNDDLLVRRSRAARYLDVSDATMQRLLSSGAVPSVKIGSARRIAVADLEAYVEQLRAESGGARR